MDTPEFVEFQKIPRLRRECIISEKIDGTNGAIFIGKLLGDAAGCDLRKAGNLTYLVGTAAAFASFALATVSLITS